MKQESIAVTGAGGFIGGVLIAEFRRQCYTKLRAIDIKPLDEWRLRFDDVENTCAWIYGQYAAREKGLVAAGVH